MSPNFQENIYCLTLQKLISRKILNSEGRFFFQIRESHWLNGIDWPEADNEFRSMSLRVPFETSELTEAEAKTREVIKEIGIDETLLESHIEKGPRSHVIGAFRIAQHK